NPGKQRSRAPGQRAATRRDVRPRSAFSAPNAARLHCRIPVGRSWRGAPCSRQRKTHLLIAASAAGHVASSALFELPGPAVHRANKPAKGCAALPLIGWPRYCGKRRRVDTVTKTAAGGCYRAVACGAILVEGDGVCALTSGRVPRNDEF